MFTVQIDSDAEEYRIVGPEGEEGGAVTFGEIAVLKIDDAIYYADMEGPGGDPTVYSVQSIRKMPTTLDPEDYEFTPEDENEDEPGPVLVETEVGSGAPEVVE